MAKGRGFAYHGRMRAPIIPIFTGGRARLLTFDLSGNVDPLKLTVADIVEEVGRKDPRAVGSWRELSAEEYSRSFAVARTAGYSVIRELYDALVTSFGSQETSEDFAGRVMPLLKRRGWVGGDEGAIAKRLELIYDTNLRVARSAGRWNRYKRTAAAFPYLRGVTARDERVRHPPRSPDSDHRAFDGIILPVGHGFWQRYFVPLGFRCRCSIIPMTRSQLARWPTGVTSEEDLREREARLGPPVFQAPGSFEAQLAGIASIANEARLPGQPALDMRSVRMTGQRLLTEQLLSEGIDEIADVLNRLFGMAA